MKRIITIVLVLLLVVGCSSNINKKNENSKYFDLIELISNRDEFSISSGQFNIDFEMNDLNDGSHRFYITIDKPRISMYEIEAIAIEKDVDYSETMAANIGVFDADRYNMIPNQVNTEKGFYEGITISGVTNSETPVIYCLVQWKNSESSETTREYFKFTVE